MSYTPNLQKLSVSAAGKVASAVQADSATTATTATSATTAATTAFAETTKTISDTYSISGSNGRIGTTNINLGKTITQNATDSIRAENYLVLSSSAEAGNSDYGGAEGIAIGSVVSSQAFNNYGGSSYLTSTGLLVIGGKLDWGLGLSSPTYIPNTTYITLMSVTGINIRFNATNDRVQFNNSSPYAYKTGGGTWGAISDSRLKHSIKDINNALDKILTLHPVHYQFINQGEDANPAGTRTGFIAQEFEQVLPGHTFEMEPMCDADKQLLGEGVKAKGIEADLIPYLVKAIQELSIKHDAVKAELDAVKAELSILKE
jgi:hypothetical protein